MKKALHVFDDLPNNYAQTNVTFSPDEELFLTGTSVEKNNTTGGLLCFYDRAKMELVSRVGISPTYSVVQCAWHPRINQVIQLYFIVLDCFTAVCSNYVTMPYRIDNSILRFENPKTSDIASVTENPIAGFVPYCYFSSHPALLVCMH